jgi:hypothetical protein
MMSLKIAGLFLAAFAPFWLSYCPGFDGLAEYDARVVRFFVQELMRTLPGYT